MFSPIPKSCYSLAAVSVMSHMANSYAEKREPLTRNARTKEGVTPEYSPRNPRSRKILRPTANADSARCPGGSPCHMEFGGNVRKEGLRATPLESVRGLRDRRQPGSTHGLRRETSGHQNVTEL